MEARQNSAIHVSATERNLYIARLIEKAKSFLLTIKAIALHLIHNQRSGNRDFTVSYCTVYVSPKSINKQGVGRLHISSILTG